jgi:sortase (surface protein transpeptidase)
MLKHPVLPQLRKLFSHHWLVTLCVASVVGLLWMGAPAWAAPSTRPLNQTVPRPTPVRPGESVATATPRPNGADEDENGDVSEGNAPGQTPSIGPNITFPQEGDATTTPESSSGSPTPGSSSTLIPGSANETAVEDEIEAPIERAAGPVRLQIEEIDLDIPVIAMGWRLDVVKGKRTTVWDVPLEEAGWHINSMGAGGEGNTIISGHQVDGDAVFAPLALGEIEADQEILLTDGEGVTFVYRVTEVTEPLPITGATKKEMLQAAEYFTPTKTATLTLVTGWPDFTTSHRVFAVAELEGELETELQGKLEDE